MTTDAAKLLEASLCGGEKLQRQSAAGQLAAAGRLQTLLP